MSTPPWCPASGRRLALGVTANRVACPLCDKRVPHVAGKLVSHRQPARVARVADGRAS